MNQRPYCTVPFVEGFSGITSRFRNCCTADPQIESLPGHSFKDWWQDPRRIDFAERQWTQEPLECYRCQIQEQQEGSSFRTAVNEQICMTKNFGKWPSRWNIKFGNICNLACWTCSEHSSSVIAQHKKTIGILPMDFVDPQIQFQHNWSELEKDILLSYEYHDTITLTLLGGEPLFNKTVVEFLERLISLGLASRTRLEFHTNATKINASLLAKNCWNYVCVFLSLDAIGAKAEWLRYGSKWSVIESNIDFFKHATDYTEVHCTLSILNIGDLSDLAKFCRNHDLKLRINLLSQPDYMSILSWPGDKNLIIDNDNQDNQFDYHYGLIGKIPDNTAIIKLKDYINKFRNIRKDLVDYDAKLARAIGLDNPG